MGGRKFWGNYEAQPVFGGVQLVRKNCLLLRSGALEDHAADASEWFNHLYYTGDEHLSRWDVIQALVNIAIYMSLKELEEAVALIGDGARETFIANFTST